MKRLLFLVPVMALASEQPRFKYTTQQLRALKPPLSAQLYTLKPKACFPPVHMPTVDVPYLSLEGLQSPSEQRRTLRKPSRTATPNNTPELKAIG